VYFIVFDDEVVINRQIALRTNKEKSFTKDLRLKEIFDEKSGYQKRKQFNIVEPNKPFDIEDVYNCDYQLFDGLDKLFIHLRENCSSGREEFKKWEFLLRWDQLEF